MPFLPQTVQIPKSDAKPNANPNPNHNYNPSPIALTLTPCLYDN